MFKAKITESQLNKAIQKVILEYFDKNDKYNQVSLVDDPKVRSGKAWADNIDNFPVERNGKIFYVSRSVAMSMYCYCKNKNGEWCVLANKRGNGAPNYQGMWNVPCGYLSWNESAEEGSARECWEETGVKIPLDKIQQQGVNSHNFGGSQNVTIRFAAVLDGTTDDYPLSMANCEPGEVSDVAWIPLQYVKSLKWAFGQYHKVGEQAKTSLGYDEKTGQCLNDLNYKINALKSALRGKSPYEYQLFNQILQDLKDYRMA